MKKYQITNPFLSGDYFLDLEMIPRLFFLFSLGRAYLQYYLLKFFLTTTPFFLISQIQTELSTKEQQLTKFTMPSAILYYKIQSVCVIVCVIVCLSVHLE